jgi:hypothetical protein
MLSCPRCVRPVPPEAAQCPSCGYDIHAAARSAPHAAPGRVAEVQPGAPLSRPGGVTAAPWDETGTVARQADEASTLIPGFAEGPPQGTGPPQDQRHYWWIGGAVLAGLVVLAVIVGLAASRIGHRGAASATTAITTAVLTPTGGSSPSGAASSSATGPGSGSASTRPANHQRGLAQASIIAGYLTASGQARQGIGAAISAISRCASISSAVATLHSAADVRSHIVTELATADVSALPNGAAAVADLGRAMRASANADRHYAAWGRDVVGCHGHAPSNPDLVAAQHSDTVATAAKQRFADEWNPIAATYGLAKQNADTI